MPKKRTFWSELAGDLASLGRRLERIKAQTEAGLEELNALSTQVAAFTQAVAAKPSNGATDAQVEEQATEAPAEKAPF